VQNLNQLLDEQSIKIRTLVETNEQQQQEIATWKAKAGDLQVEVGNARLAYADVLAVLEVSYFLMRGTIGKSW
jgi:NADPH:quinone reductase-like Zn-dependent oxidoreductase